MATPLSHADVRRLKLVLECGNELEKMWAEETPSTSETAFRLRDHTLQRLIAAIHALEQADSENVRRVSFHTRNLSLEMTARHLAAILVPFERLLGKALRDDEILIDEGDAPTARGETKPLRLIADNLRSAFNVGALLRTAECFGVEHVVLAGYTPTPDNDKTARTSLGTEKSVAWSREPNVHQAIKKAKDEGYKVIALETARDASTLQDFSWPEKCALVLGNERFGLDRDVLDQCDHFVKIPMHGLKNSLNVGIAAGIALAKWREQIDSATPNEIRYHSIATFSSNAKHPYEAPRQAVVDQSGHEGRIYLPPRLRETLKDLEGFDRLWLIYDFHHNKNWKPLVMPPRGARKKRGVFATRSPYRPNSIGLSCVELVKIEGTTLTVRSTDLLDGTPILDIKPYVAYADSFPDAKEGWLKSVEGERFQVTWAPLAARQIAWLETNGLSQIRSTLTHQLEFSPLDDERKRVKSYGAIHLLAYRTWRARFSIVDQIVLIESIESGYSDEELAADDDRYRDKEIHRAFRAQNRVENAE